MNYRSVILVLLSLAKNKIPILGLLTIHKDIVCKINNMRAKYIVYRFMNTLDKEDKVLFTEIVEKVKKGDNVRQSNIFDKLLGRQEKQDKLFELGQKFKIFSINHCLMKYNF